MRKGVFVAAVFSAVAVAGAGAAQATVTIFDSRGQALSIRGEGPQSPASAPPSPGAIDAVSIDLWCCGADPLDWGLNSSYYWATAFDTNGISSPHAVTEVRWFADGGEPEDYWIAPDLAGEPDGANAAYLGGQTVPASGFVWQSFDASGAGVVVEPGKIYWFIRASSPPGGFGFSLTWRSTTNPSPPLPDPVSISLSLAGGWSAWVSGLNWQMEYEILGDPAEVGPQLSIGGSCPGSITIAVSGATPGGTVGLLWATGPGMAVVPAGPCAGTPLGLANPHLLTALTADAGGNAMLTQNAPAAACDLSLQALDIASCDPTGVAQIP